MSEKDSPEWPQALRPQRPHLWIAPGLALCFAAFFLLFWNETKILDHYQNLDQGIPEVHSVRMDRIDPEMNGKLVHISGLAITGETLTDPVFDVSANAVKLRRDVQVYQWREKRVTVVEDDASGTPLETMAIYEKIWSDAMIPSSGFQVPEGHANPSAPPYKSKEFAANTVTLGAFTLSRSFIEQIDRFHPLKLDPDALSRLPEDIRWEAHRETWGFFIGEDPKNPEIGDMRIEFHSAGPLTVTVVARQAGNLLLPYPVGGGVLRIGSHGIDGMFPQALRRSVLLIWGFRLGGFVAMFAGLVLVLIPILRRKAAGPFVRAMSAKADPFLLAFLMAPALSFGAIAAVWFAARPVLAGVLIGAALVFLLGLRMLPDRHSD